MEYAVLKTGGKQYKVSKGDVLDVEKLEGISGEKISFNEVLLYVSGDKSKIGTPSVDKVKVLGKVVDQRKGEKIRVSKFKSKVRHRRVTGHRQLLTRVEIEEITH